MEWREERKEWRRKRKKEEDIPYKNVAHSFFLVSGQAWNNVITVSSVKSDFLTLFNSVNSGLLTTTMQTLSRWNGLGIKLGLRSVS